MKINGWDISEAQAKQWNVNPGFSDVENESEWQRGSPLPFFAGNFVDFKTIQITFLVYGRGRNEILENCSRLLSKFLEPADLELDGFSHKFYGIMSKNDFSENPLGRLRITNNRLSKVTVDFSCYEYAEQPDGSPFQESTSGKSETTVTNPGTIYTPAIVEITPQLGMGELTVTGITYNPDTGEDIPVTIRKLTADKTIVLDGETGIWTEDGQKKSSDDIDIWALPSLRPGANNITLSSQQINLSIKFRPRYM